MIKYLKPVNRKIFQENYIMEKTKKKNVAGSKSKRVHNQLKKSTRSKYLSGDRIFPKPVSSKTTITSLVEEVFVAYNSGRLSEACRLYHTRMLQPEVTVGLSMTGALSPAGLGISCLVPMIQNGFVDWIISTGAILYHDTHFAIGCDLHRGSPFMDDVKLHKEGVVRIYDILFDYTVLLSTDAFYRQVIQSPEFQKDMSSAEFHYLIGKYLFGREKALGLKNVSILSAAYQCGVPIYTSSPGDSSIGMNIAAMSMRGNKLRLDPNLDVNETASIVWNAKVRGGKHGVFILGGGSPKNFMLQTEPQIQEVLGIEESGHDYFVQFTDARPDTGGLSGATPSEAVSWGKVDPQTLPDTVVCYGDTTILLPLLTAYIVNKHKPRPLKRLYDRRIQLYEALKSTYLSLGLK